MSAGAGPGCRRAFEVDLADYLADPGRPERDDFRAHYPGCPACAAEVAAWTELHLRLGAGTGEDHPPERLLLAYEDRPAQLDPTDRDAVEAHLARCLPCRDELSALRGLAEAEGAAAAPRAARPTARPPATGPLAGIRRLALHPAFAYALVLLLLYPAVRGARDHRDAPPPVAERESRPERTAKLERRGPAPPPERASRPTREAARRAPAPFAAPSAPAAAPPTPAAGPPVPSATVPLADEADEAGGAPAAAEAPRGLAGLGVRGRGVDSDATTAAPASRAAAALTAAAPTVLGDGASVAVQAPLPGERLLLRLVLPAGPGGDVEVRVTEAGGQREIRERLATLPGAPHAEVALPGAWLRPGEYGVRVEAGGALLARGTLLVR